MNAPKVDDPRWDSDKWAWARQRLPHAPRSILELVLDAMDRGFLCDRVHEGSVVLRRFAHHASDHGTIITLYFWKARDGRPGRFSGAKVERVDELDNLNTRDGALHWVHRFDVR